MKMKKQIKERAELFTLINEIHKANRRYFSRYFKTKHPTLKVQWIEVNKPYIQDIILHLNPRQIDTTLLEVEYGGGYYWIDISDSRIWQIFTFSKTSKLKNFIKNRMTSIHGVDRVWFPDNFYSRIQSQFQFTSRGFGIQYKTLYSEEPNKFSAKIWLGKTYNEEEDGLIAVADKRFSKSSIRFGKTTKENDEITGQLHELYYRGHLTVNTCDDQEELLSLFRFIRQEYRKEIEYLEKERNRTPTLIEIVFSDSVNRDGISKYSDIGKAPLKLWLHKLHEDDGLIRYSGVDLHTSDFIHIDMAEEYSYLSPAQKACMNVAPRFGVLASRYLSTNVTIYHDGVELFAKS